MAASARPASARALEAAVTEAVTAALATNADAFAIAIAHAASRDQERLVVIQGAIINELLEERYPDGLASADAQEVLQRCLDGAERWLPIVDTDLMVEVILGALGASDASESPSDRAALATHGALLIADLIAAPGENEPRPLDEYLRRAMDEIQRAETMEMP